MFPVAVIGVISVLMARGVDSTHELGFFHPECVESNAGPPKMIPHLEDCSRFWLCVGGVAYNGSCPRGMHFNKDLGVCDRPQVVGCQKERATEPRCPQKNSRVATLLPHPFDCSSFYFCDGDHPTRMKCPDGLHFNPRMSLCDIPERAKCEMELQSHPVSTGIQHTNCPSKDPHDPVILPHSSDCSKFYICSNGKAFEKICMPGLHFNPRLRVCDYPGNVNCANAPRSVKKPRCPERTGKMAKLIPHETNCNAYYVCENHDQTIQMFCPDDLHFNRRLSVCDFPEEAECEAASGKDLPVTDSKENDENQLKPDPTGSPHPFCPSINGALPVFFGHPFNCSIYYMCGNGLAYEFTCTDGLHFNEKKKVCDTQLEAGCLKEDRSGRQLLPDGECPKRDRGNAVLLPHKTDCTRYYMCQSGEPIVKDCPDDLHFNPHKKVCDYPDMAGCQAEDRSGRQLLPDGECPKRDRGNAVLLPHKTDCTRYYMCQSGEPIVKDCPDDLHFNPHKKVCDYPDMAGCQEGKFR